MKQILSKSLWLKACMFVAALFMSVEGAWASTYKKITSDSELEVNAKYILVCESKGKALGAISTTSTKYGLPVDVTVSDDKITIPTGVDELTLLGSTTGGWRFKSSLSDGSLSWTSGNSLNISSTATEWSISFTDGNATISPTSDSSRKLRYNAGSPRFACYTSDQTVVQLYKEVTDPSDTRTDVTLSFPENSYTGTLGTAFTTPSLTADPEAAASAVTYSSDNSEVASVDATTGAITLNASGTATITASIKDNDTYKDAIASYTLTVVDPNIPGQTATNPYTVTQAIAAIDAGTGLTNVYVKGIISQIDSYNSNYGSITYWISDDGTTTNQFEVYSGLNIDGAQFTSVEDLKVGADVVIYGNIKKYNEIYEFDKNNVLISIVLPEKAEAGLAFETTEFNLNVGDEFTAPTLTNPNDLTVTWTSSNETVATVTDGVVTLTGTAGTTVITATFAGDDNYLAASVSYTINVVDPNDPGSTAENPYTVAEALEVINALEDGATTENSVYVAGTITAITEVSTDHGNATYTISDGTNVILVYRGKYLENANFESADQIQVDDQVVVYGKLQKYVKNEVTTPEIASGNYLYSLTRPVTPVTITAPSFTPAAGEVEVGTTITINVPEDDYVDYVQYSYDQETWTEYDADNTVITINKETTIYARSVSVDEEYSAVVSATYTIKAEDYATLPFAYDGNGSGTLPAGLTQSGVGTYSSSPAMKFDGTGDYLLLKFNETPGVLTFDIKGNGFSGGTFTLQVSTDGETYTDKASYTTLESSTTTITVSDLAEDVRYIKWVYTTKSSGNVALGNINLAKPSNQGVITVAETSLDLDAAEHEGTIEVTYLNIEETELQLVDAEGETATYDWLEAELTTDGNIYYVVGANEGEERTAYMKVYGLDKEAAAVYSDVITITQAAPVIVSTDKYKLVTDATTLAANDEILLAYVVTDTETSTSTATAMGGQNTNNRAGVEVTLNADGTLSPNSDTQVVTLEGTTGAWNFKVDGGYLYAASSSSNHLKTETEIDENGNAKAIIAIDTNGTASIIFQGTNSRNVLQYNDTNNLFACYSSASQKAVQIYKKVVKGDVNGDGSVTIADVTALVNIILGKDNTEPYEYDHDAADVNTDNTITIADVTALVNIILGK